MAWEHVSVPPQHLLRLIRVDSELTAMNPVAFDVANGNLQLAVTSISFWSVQGAPHVSKTSCKCIEFTYNLYSCEPKAAESLGA
jgi:hypothetical protein